MKYVARTLRLAHIYFVIVRYNLGDLAPIFYPFRFLSYLNPLCWTRRNKLSRGQRIRCALEDLGPIFIKAGQVLSTRRDFLPDDVAEELAKLQDQVPPFPGKIAQRIIETALGQSITTVFQAFDTQALASASVAQVHAAILLNGKAAVVKVLRPGIEKVIARDIDLLFVLAGLAARYSSRARRFKPREIVEEIANTLRDELDLMREGANGSQLRRNFQNSDLLYVPEIYWNYCRANILVMERITGIPVHNISALKQAGLNLRSLAERSVEIFFTQVFRDSFFHADMHPGNIFVSTANLEKPQYIAVDFGIMGSLSSRDQRYLAENMLAFFKRDYQRVAELHVASGWLPPDTRIDQFEGAIRAVCEPVLERPWKEVSFGELLLRLLQTARRFNINIQPQLILLQKTLLNVEGVGRQIYPDLDIWTTAAPYLEKWLRKQVGPRAFLRRVRESFPVWSEKLPEIPGLLYEVLNNKRDEQVIHRFTQGAGSTSKQARQKPYKVYYLLLGVCGGILLSSAVLFLRSMS